MKISEKLKLLLAGAMTIVPGRLDVGLTNDKDEARSSGIDPETGQHRRYWVMTDEERSKGFVRPVRKTYIHERCGGATTMSRAIAETYAVDPKAYGRTFCVHCGSHFPVGENGEFVWDGTQEKVGT